MYTLQFWDENSIRWSLDDDRSLVTFCYLLLLYKGSEYERRVYAIVNLKDILKIL